MTKAKAASELPHFCIVVAMDEAGGIGKDGALPWKLSADMAHFRKLTLGAGNNTVIMGRKTWASIPEKFRPLPGRHNIVLTRSSSLKLSGGVTVANNLEQALAIAAESGDVFVIGGGALYSEAARHPSCKTVFMTAIHATFDCDTFFLPNEADWQLTEDSPPQVENDISFSFCRYTKLNPN